MDHTLIQVLTYLATAGTIAILLSRIPGWQERVPANVKPLIVTLLNVIAPVALAVAQVLVPPQYQNQTLTELLTGLAMAAVSFIVHHIDDWLATKQNAPAVVTARFTTDTTGGAVPLVKK